MKTVTRNAVFQLYEKTETLGQQPHDSWRCIYLKLSDKQERYNHELRTNFIARAITDLLSNIDGYIYFCDDGDIFILFQGTMKKVVEKLSTHFADINPQQLRGQASNSIFSLFDLSKHWQGFHQVCETKYLRMIAAIEESRMNSIYHHRPAHTIQRMPQA
jgi:acylphosphatase